MKRVLAILVLTVGALFACAAAEIGTVGSLNVADGLSNRMVYKIAQDSRGFMWFCTRTAIDRFDGAQVRQYALPVPDDVSTEIPVYSRVLAGVTASGRDEVLVFHSVGLLFVYDPVMDRFRLEEDFRDTYPGLLFYDYELFPDGSSCLTTSGGVYFRTGEDSYCILPGETVYDVEQVGNASSGHFLVASSAGLHVVRKEVGGWQERKLSCMDGIPCTYIFVDGTAVFAGTEMQGMWKVDVEDDTAKRIGGVNTRVPIRRILRTKSGNLIAGTDGDGLFLLDPRGESVIQNYREENGDGVPANTISDLFRDRDGFFWISTTTHGVSYSAVSSIVVEIVRHTKGDRNSIDSDHVNVIREDSRGNLWMGTNTGINVRGKDSSRWRRIAPAASSGAGVVLAVEEDAQGRIWFGGYGIDLAWIDPDTYSVHIVDRNHTNTYKLVRDGDYIWAGGISAPLARFHTASMEEVQFSVPEVVSIQVVSPGRILFSATQGVGYADASTGEVSVTREFGGRSLTSPVRQVLKSSAGDWYMATSGDGLVIVSESGETTRFLGDGSKPLGVVSAVAEDRGGRIWVTTEEDLYCIDSETRKIIPANDYIGLASGVFNPDAFCVMANGNVYVGTGAGAIGFVPEFIEENETEPVIPVLTDLRISGELSDSLAMAATGGVAVDAAERVVLKYRQNTFDIGFSAVDWSRRYRMEFQYSLEGYSDMVRSANGPGTASFMNVSPGSYVFVMNVVDRYTGALLGSRRLPVVVRHPWWLTGWAYLAYFLLVLSAVIVFLRVKRRREYEALITDKIDTFISVAHDLKTPVSLIKAPIGELENMDDMPQGAQKLLSMASGNADRLMGMINELLDLRKDYARSELIVAPVPLGDYLSDKFYDFRVAATQKGLKTYLEVDPQLKTVPVDKRTMDHIIENLLSNAIKYTKEGSVSLRAVRQGKKWCMTVEDTGIGIPSEYSGHVFNDTFRAANAEASDSVGSGIGLMITRQLVHRHKGEISFTSEEGKGTVFTLAFPLAYSSNETAGPVSGHAADVPAEDRRSGTADSRTGEMQARIMLVDDSAEMADYLESSFGEDYELVVCNSAEDALKHLVEQNPDVVITDVMMPGMNGYDFCAAIKANVETSHIPVILLTGLDAKENIIRGFEVGASDYVTKPFDMSVLRLRVRNILKERSRYREAVLASDGGERPSGEDYLNVLDKNFMDKVISTLEEEIANSEFQINDLCRELAMSRTAFYNKLKSLTGQAPADFIRIYRLNRAKEILARKEYSISEVADMVGFSDAKYFSVCFKKQFGISPSRV